MLNWLTEKIKQLIDGRPLNAIAQQLLRTGGNVSESAFIVATLWVICNAVAHTVISWWLSASTITLFNSFAAIAFTILPELIAVSTTSKAIDLWRVTYQQKDNIAKLWAIFYTVLAGIFVVMTIVTISTFASTDGSQFIPLNGWQLCIRALAGWSYAFINMLYKDFGKAHIATVMSKLNQSIDDLKGQIDRVQNDFALKLQAKETEIEQLHTDFNQKLDRKQSEVDQFQSMVKTQFDQLQQAREKASQERLQDLSSYPLVISELLETGAKTVLYDDIARLTGHSKQRLSKAKLQRHSRNKDLVMVASLVEWLRNAPVPSSFETGQTGYTNGHSYHDTDALALPYLSVVESD